MRLFNVELRLWLLGVVAVIEGGSATFFLMVGKIRTGVGFVALAALFVYFARLYYRYVAEFHEVWLNGDRVEIRHGRASESVPLAAVTRIEYGRYHSRDAASVRLHFVSGGDTPREVRFFPADVSVMADSLAIFSGGRRVKESRVVDELRRLVHSAKESHAHLTPLISRRGANSSARTGREIRMTYPWGDFVADYDAWLMRVQEAVKSQTPSNADWERRNFELAADAFRERYADERQRRDRMMRFGLIMKHVSAHTEDYDVGKYAIATRGGSGVSWPLMRAVHSFVADELPGKEPSPELVLHRAREFRDERL